MLPPDAQERYELTFFMASNHPGCLLFIEATQASTAFLLYMHSLEGLGFPSGDTWIYSLPTIQHSFLARRMVPGLSPVTAIRTLSQTHSLGANWRILLMVIYPLPWLHPGELQIAAGGRNQLIPDRGHVFCLMSRIGQCVMCNPIEWHISLWIETHNSA